MGTTFIDLVDSGGAAKKMDASGNPANSSALILHRSLPTQWVVSHTPAVATAAVASKAAGTGAVRHVCSGISATIGGANITAGTVTINLRDDASGTGSILCAWIIPYPGASAHFYYQINLSDLAIMGTALKAMTLEFASVPAGCYATANLFGFDVA